MTPPTTKGMLLSARVESFEILRALSEQLLAVGILRCLSPERLELCDAPATLIFWQDEAEWYPCCSLHWPGGEQWTGSTPFRLHRVEFPVIAELASAWLAKQDAATLGFLRVSEYDRGGMVPGE